MGGLGKERAEARSAFETASNLFKDKRKAFRDALKSLHESVSPDEKPAAYQRAKEAYSDLDDAADQQFAAYARLIASLRS